jgi:mRNA interferase RelE/StbE
MNKSVAQTIVSWVRRNLNDTATPSQHGKALTGNLAGFWRYRVGDYRILADIKNEKLIIYIVRIGHRRDIYE